MFQDAVSLVGGAIGAMHIPEKWFPGYMDYYLNSHNIMHVLVVIAVYSMHQVKPICNLDTVYSLDKTKVINIEFIDLYCSKALHFSKSYLNASQNPKHHPN